MSTIYELKQFWWCRHFRWWEPWQWPLVQGLKDPHTLAHDKNCQRQQFEAVVQCPACYTGGHTFRNDAVCQLFAIIVIGPVQSHEVDELWAGRVIFIMITPTLTGFLSLMASTCEVKVGMKADARWQSIFKCEHCEGSALASFQWKSRWMGTDYQSTTVTSTRAFNGFFFGANCHNSSSLVPNSDGEKNQCRIQSSCPAELQSNIWLFTWVAYKSFINTLRFNTATIELSIPAPRRITDGLPRQWVGAIGRNFGRDPLSLPLLLLRDPLSPIGHNFRFPLICLSLRTPTHERRNGLPKF